MIIKRLQNHINIFLYFLKKVLRGLPLCQTAGQQLPARISQYRLLVATQLQQDISVLL